LKDTIYLFVKMENPKQVISQVKEERLVRILSKDIPGNMSVYAGLIRINGISWSVSNAICKILGIDKGRRIDSLSVEEIKKITDLAKKEGLPSYLNNRRKDFETGEDKHLIGSDLELQKDFDIKRLKKIKSYRGFRHMSNLPVRGQRTRGHFRSNRRKGAGIKRKNKK